MERKITRFLQLSHRDLSMWRGRLHAALPPSVKATWSGCAWTPLPCTQGRGQGEGTACCEFARSASRRFVLSPPALSPEYRGEGEGASSCAQRRRGWLGDNFWCRWMPVLVGWVYSPTTSDRWWASTPTLQSTSPVVLRYSEASGCSREWARCFGVPQHDGPCSVLRSKVRRRICSPDRSRSPAAD
jgi:hypothetical protein